MVEVGLRQNGQAKGRVRGVMVGGVGVEVMTGPMPV